MSALQGSDNNDDGFFDRHGGSGGPPDESDDFAGGSGEPPDDNDDFAGDMEFDFSSAPAVLETQDSQQVPPHRSAAGDAADMSAVQGSDDNDDGFFDRHGGAGEPPDEKDDFLGGSGEPADDNDDFAGDREFDFSSAPAF
eukprot:2088273-Amphidinium_carterae.1